MYYRFFVNYSFDLVNFWIIKLFVVFTTKQWIICWFGGLQSNLHSTWSARSARFLLALAKIIKGKSGDGIFWIQKSIFILPNEICLNVVPSGGRFLWLESLALDELTTLTALLTSRLAACWRLDAAVFELATSELLVESSTTTAQALALSYETGRKLEAENEIYKSVFWTHNFWVASWVVDQNILKIFENECYESLYNLFFYCIIRL